MKKIIYGVLTAMFCLFAQQVTVYAQSDCDVVANFEDNVAYEGAGKASDIAVVTFLSSQALKFQCAYGGVSWIKIPIANGAINSTYLKIEFDIANSASVSGKNLIAGYSIDGNSFSNISNQNNQSFSNWAWQHYNIDLTSVANTASYIGIGIYNDNTTYYIDNIRVFVIPANCVTTIPDEDATLSSLTVSQGILTPTFAAATTNYTVNVANDIESITIAATATQADNGSSDVSGTGTQSLDVGANTFVITVTAPDGTTTKEYTIVVNRADENVGCDIIFDFESDGTTYSGNNVSNVAVFANTVSTGNPSASALQFSVTNYGAYIKLQVKEGKLSDNYSTIEFDIATGENSDQLGKQIVFGSSTDGTSFSTENKSVQNAFPGNDQTIYKSKWRHLSISVGNLGTTIKDKTGTTYFALGVYDNSSRIYYIDNVILTAKAGTCPTTYRWTPGESGSTDWTTATNWTPNGTPGAIDRAIIKQSASYPVLEDNISVRNLTIEPNAAIDLSTYTLSAENVKVQTLMDAQKWYSIGFPFAVTAVYSEDFSDFLTAGTNFWLKSLNETGTGFTDANTIAASSGYIIELPSGFGTNQTISYSSDAAVVLSNNELSFGENYALQANPTLAPLHVNLAGNRHIYRLQYDEPVGYVLSDGETVEPFEAVLTVEKANPPQRISLNPDVVTSIDTNLNETAVVARHYYNLQGAKIAQPTKGSVYLVKEILESGAVNVSKSIIQ